MIKVELARAISKETGVDQPTVMAVLEGMMKVVKDTLVSQENVYLRGFGTFSLKRRKEKIARNISLNTSIVVPEHDIPSFKPCKEFMDDVVRGPQTKAQKK